MTGRPDAFEDSDATGTTDRVENGDTDEIREQIRDTRSRMSSTLDQLGERLNPHAVKSQLTEHVKDSIREATVGRVSHMARQAKDQVMSAERSLIRTARENPIPAAMIGIGLAWIILNSRRHRSETNGYASASRLTDYDEDTALYDAESEATMGGESTGGLRHGLETVRERAAEIGGTVRERAAEIGGTIKQKVSAVGQKTTTVANSLATRASDMASSVGDTTRRAAHSVAEGSRRQYQRVEEKFYENPLAIGALVMAAGLAVGLSVPRTETESRLMGDASERLTDRARDAVRETRDKVQHVAERVVEEGKRTAGEAMREQGLSART
jgi:hypothetical protein